MVGFFENSQDVERTSKDECVEWLPFPSRESLEAKYSDESCWNRIHRPLIRYALNVGFENPWVQRFVHSSTERDEPDWYHLAVRYGCAKSFSEAFKNLQVFVLPYSKDCDVSGPPEERRDPDWVRHRHSIVVVKDDSDGKKYKEALDGLRMSEGPVPENAKLYHSKRFVVPQSIVDVIEFLKSSADACCFRDEFLDRTKKVKVVRCFSDLEPYVQDSILRDRELERLGYAYEQNRIRSERMKAKREETEAKREETVDSTKKASELKPPRRRVTDLEREETEAKREELKPPRRRVVGTERGDTKEDNEPKPPRRRVADPEREDLSNLIKKASEPNPPRMRDLVLERHFQNLAAARAWKERHGWI